MLDAGSVKWHGARETCNGKSEIRNKFKAPNGEISKPEVVVRKTSGWPTVLPPALRKLAKECWAEVTGHFQLIIEGATNQVTCNLSQDGRRNSLSRTSAAQYRAIIGRLSEGANGAIVSRLLEDKRSRIGRKRALEAQGINDPGAT
jgi:hypothetical protein